MPPTNASRARTLRGVADQLEAPFAMRQKLDNLTKRRDKSQTAGDERYMRNTTQTLASIIATRREELMRKVQALESLQRQLDGSSSPRPTSPPKSKSPTAPKSPKTPKSKSPKSKSPKTPKSKSPKRRLTFVDA